MKIVAAPDKFRGTATAGEIASAVALVTPGRVLSRELLNQGREFGIDGWSSGACG